MVSLSLTVGKPCANKVMQPQKKHESIIAIFFIVIYKVVRLNDERLKALHNTTYFCKNNVYHCSDNKYHCKNDNKHCFYPFNK